MSKSGFAHLINNLEVVQNATYSFLFNSSNHYIYLAGAFTQIYQGYTFYTYVSIMFHLRNLLTSTTYKLTSEPQEVKSLKVFCSELHLPFYNI